LYIFVVNLELGDNFIVWWFGGQF